MIKATEVELLGNSYTIKSEKDSARVKEIASYLNSKMKEIRSAAPDATLLKVVILSAFHITEELLGYREELSETLNIMEEKTANILKMLEDLTIFYSNTENRQDSISYS